jgi:hypothetical protein
MVMVPFLPGIGVVLGIGLSFLHRYLKFAIVALSFFVVWYSKGLDDVLVFPALFLPAAGTYGIFRKEKKIIIGTGICIVLFLFKEISFHTILLFIMALFYLELGTAAELYGSALERMGESSGLNRALKYYFLHLIMAIALCSGISLAFLFFRFSVGIWVSIFLTLLGAYLLFYLVH